MLFVVQMKVSMNHLIMFLSAMLLEMKLDISKMHLIFLVDNGLMPPTAKAVVFGLFFQSSHLGFRRRWWWRRNAARIFLCCTCKSYMRNIMERKWLYLQNCVLLWNSTLTWDPFGFELIFHYALPFLAGASGSTGDNRADAVSYLHSCFSSLPPGFYAVPDNT